ncbi:MAG: ABC transporter permease subunit [Clostridia bacterium]|nr:ABC transporter permease subunit [Clostridia bacterium]
MKTSILSNKLLKGLLALVFWTAVWYLAAALINKELFLPYPHIVVKRFAFLLVKPFFLKTVFVSLARILAGFCLGVFLGFGLAFFTHYFAAAKAIVSPAIRVIRATPVVSFILLAYLWLNNDSIPVFIAVLMVAPIIWQNISAGLSNLDGGLLEMAKIFKLSPAKIFRRIILPQLKPHFYSGCMTSLGLAWKSGIAAEVISYPKTAIGREMNDARMLLETTDVLVFTVTVIILSLAFEGVFKLIFEKSASSKIIKRRFLKKGGESK